MKKIFVVIKWLLGYPPTNITSEPIKKACDYCNKHGDKMKLVSVDMVICHACIKLLADKILAKGETE